jgi:hypothetical protein
VSESFAQYVNTITPADPDSLHGPANNDAPMPGRPKKEKAVTIRANIQTSMRLAALLVVAAIMIATSYGIAMAVRSGGCIIAQKVERTAEVAAHALRRLDA